MEKTKMTMLVVCLALMLSSNFISGYVFDKYVSFIDDEVKAKAGFSRCRFSSTADVIKHYSHGIYQKDELPLDVVACLEGYSRSYIIPLHGVDDAKTYWADEGIRVGFGTDCSKLAVDVKLTKACEPDDKTKFFGLTGSKAYDALKTFTDSNNENYPEDHDLFELLNQHYIYFKSLLLEKTQRKEISVNIVRSLFLYYFNNYDLLKVDSDATKAVLEMLKEDDKNFVPSYFLDHPTLDWKKKEDGTVDHIGNAVPAPRRFLSYINTNKISFTPGNLVIVLSSIPSIMTDLLKSKIADEINRRVLSLKTAKYAENSFHLTVITADDKYLEIVYTGLPSDERKDIKAIINGLTPKVTDEKEVIVLNNKKISSQIDLLYGAGYHKNLVIWTFSRLSDYRDPENNINKVINFVLEPEDEKYKTNSYPYNYFFPDFTNFSSDISININSFFYYNVDDSLEENSYTKQKIGKQSANFFQTHKTYNSYFDIFYKDIGVNKDDTKRTVDIYHSPWNPFPQLNPHEYDYSTTRSSTIHVRKHGLPIIGANPVDISDITEHIFNKQQEEWEKTKNPANFDMNVYVQINNQGADMDYLFAYSESSLLADDSGITATADFVITPTPEPKPEPPQPEPEPEPKPEPKPDPKPVDPTPSPSKTGTDYTVANAILLTLTVVSLLAAVVVFIRTPNVGDKYSNLNSELATR